MSTMPLPVIVDHLVRITGCQDELAKAFIVELSEIISNALVDNGQIEVAGIGVFRVVTTAEGSVVELIPDQALALAVNQPFAMFEPVELDDEITEEMLASVEDDHEAEQVSVGDASMNNSETQNKETLLQKNVSEPIVSENQDSVVDENSVVSEVDNLDTYEISDNEDEVSAGNVNGAFPPPIPDDILTGGDAYVRNDGSYERRIVNDLPMQPASDNNREDENRRERTPHFVPLMILIGVICLLSGLALGYFAYERLNLHGVKSVNISAEEVQVIHSTQDVFTVDPLAEESIEIVLPDTVSDFSQEQGGVSTEGYQVAVPATDNDKIVTDTVRNGRFLTTIALEHYGMKKFWVYIYMENMDKLGDPDLIQSGTVVVVPPAEKYGICAGDAASEAIAEQKAAEILATYSKKN